MMMTTPKIGGVALATAIAVVMMAMAATPSWRRTRRRTSWTSTTRPAEWRASARLSESYAAERAADSAFIHSGSWEKAGYGENLFGGSGGDWTAADAVNLWVGEKDLYDYDSNSCIGSWDSCLHYTQVMWSCTTAIGCARVVCDNDGVFITCNYNPAGNFQGESPFERGLTLSA